MLLQKGVDECGLVRRHGEVVAESASGVDDLEGSLFSVVDRGVVRELRGADGGDPRAADREARDEAGTALCWDT